MDDPRLSAEELRAQITALEEQIARLQNERARLIQRLESLPQDIARPSGRARPRRRTKVGRPGEELSHDDVEFIWREEVSVLDVPADVLASAHNSLMSGLFADGRGETRLRSGTGPRPFTCPFRGRHYGTAERLVRTAMPWLVRQAEIAHPDPGVRRTRAMRELRSLVGLGLFCFYSGSQNERCKN